MTMSPLESNRSFSVTSTMNPRRPRIISDAACFAVIMRESSACRRSASVWVRFVSQNGAHPAIMGSSPATLSTRMSSLPRSRSTRSNSAATSASAVWSTCSAMALPPAALMLSAVSSMVSGRL